MNAGPAEKKASRYFGKESKTLCSVERVDLSLR